MRKILYILALIVLTSTVCPAAPKKQTVQYETSTQIPERSFGKEKLEKAKADPDYNYNIEQKKEEPSWWDKLLYKFFEFLFKIFVSPTGSAESIFFYIIVTAIVVGLILVIMRMTAVGIFSRSNKQDNEELGFSEFIEDINSIDFDKMIEEAVKTGMYRRAIRLYYLKSLKHLSDKSQIVWEINKTNRDYMYELRTPSLRSGFEDITFVYEHVWYGNMEIDAEKFSKVKSTFLQFNTQTMNVR